MSQGRNTLGRHGSRDEIQRNATTAEKYDPHNKWLAFTLKQLFVRPSDYTSAF